MQSELLGVKSMAGKIVKAGVDQDELGATAMMLVAKRMLQLAVTSPGKIKELASLGRLLVANEAQDIKRRWLELEEEKMEDALTERCRKTESNLRLQASLRQMLANQPETSGREGTKASMEEPPH